jgi:hypothetical protein
LENRCDTNKKHISAKILRQQNAEKSEMLTNDLPHIIPLVLNERYVSTKNVFPEWNFAKGTILKLIHIHNKNEPDEFLEMELETNSIPE